MYIQRFFSKREYKAGTKIAKMISDTATGIPNKEKAKQAKSAAERTADAVGKSKVVSRGKSGVFVQHDLRKSKPKKVDKGSFFLDL